MVYNEVSLQAEVDQLRLQIAQTKGREEVISAEITMIRSQAQAREYQLQQELLELPSRVANIQARLDKALLALQEYKDAQAKQTESP